MTTVEKRRSGRKSGSHRKQNDGGYSDTETDREVSSLTDRAFRSLCIGDEAVYNDSDLSASPCIQRDRQLAFSHNVLEREDRDRQELKRAAHESFSMRMQQYGQDWMYQGTYGAEIHKQQQWGVYGERGSHGRLSATFQHSFLETPQQEPPLNELSLYSNGATEVSSQQRRSRSRVSSLIRAFNSEEQRDGAVMDRKLYNDETSWDKSALMSIERELSEFSSYQQNINASYFPSAGLFSPQNTNYYSSEVAAVTQMNSASSFMRSAHSKHTMSAQVNCNSNFFIHSEFSPFKVWRDHNRFPFQQGQVSGFMHSSQFPKWYETPMYKELSLKPQLPSSMFEEQGMAYHRNAFAPAVPMNAQRSTSTSTVMHKAPAVEKRCESELAGHYPHRKRAQSLGANRLPSQRPSTASPTSEMSRRVRDTLSSVKSLQQKIKMMADQNIETQSQGVFYNNNMTPYGSNAMIPNNVSANTTIAPYTMNPMLMAAVHTAPEQQQVSVSPHPVEHAPVRAESRGATPDVKASSYRSRAASLLYNLKDNRKRVKSNYSPPKFKGLETQEKYKQEPKDFVIDVPDFPETDILNPTEERTDRLDVGLHQYGYQTHSPGMLQNPQPAQMYMGQNSMYNSSEYYRAQTQGEAAHHHGFTGFTPEYYSNNQLANGQNPHENLSSFTPYKQGVRDKGEALGNYVNRPAQSYTAAEMQRCSADSQSRDYVSKAISKHYFNEAVGGEFILVDRCNQLKENKCDYNNVYSQAKWGQTNNQETQKTGTFPTKDYPNIDPYQRANNTQEELNLPKYKYETKPNRELENYTSPPHGICTSNILNQEPHYAPLYTNNSGNAGYNTQQQPGAYGESYAPKMSQEYNQENKRHENDAPRVDHKYYDQESTKQTTFSSRGDTSVLTQESRQGKEPIVKENGMQSLRLKETELQFENSKQKNALAATGQVEVISSTNQAKDQQEQITTEVDKAGLNKFSLVKKTGSERVKAKPEKGQEQSMFKIKEKDKGVKVHATEDVPSNDEQTKQLEEKKSQLQPHELQVTDEPRHMMEAGPKRHEPDEQLIVEHANTEELKEEHIKCELAKSCKQARIEQVKPEPSRKDRVETETEQVKVPQVGAEQVERECAEKKQKEEVRESQHTENQANTQSVENKVTASKDIVKQTLTEAQTEMGEAKQVKRVKEGMEKESHLELAMEDPTNIENMKESLSKSEPKQEVRSEPDKVEQAKTELAKAKAELAKIKEKMKGEQKVRKDEEPIDKVNSNVNMDSTEQETPVKKPSVDQAQDDFNHIKEKYGFTHAMTTNRNKMSTRDTADSHDVSEQSTTAVDNIETMENKKTNTSPDKFTLATVESNESTKSISYDDKTESQYVYSESSKDFKLSIAGDLADSNDKRTNDKNAANTLKNAPVKTMEKFDPSQQKDAAQQPPVERKSTEQNIGASKESYSTPSRAHLHKERAQTKQEILTSKIKAHAEKEISAIKEGFAIRDGFKNSPKPLALSQNMTVRQKPPSQEVYKKQDSGLLNVVSPKLFSPPPGTIPIKSAGPSQSADHPQKQKNSENATEKNIPVNEGLSKSEKSPTQNTDKHPITSQGKGEGRSSPSQKETLEEKKMKSGALPKDKPLKHENVDKGDNIDRPDLQSTAPSLQLVFGQSNTSVPDDSLKIMGIMVSVRERRPLESSGEEEKEIQKELCTEKKECKENSGPSSAGELIKVDRLSEGVSKDNSKTKGNQITRENESLTIIGNREDKLTDSKTKKTQQESSLLNDRLQSKIQLTDQVAEKDESSKDTVLAKNKELAETKPLPSKHNIKAGETKDHTNKTPKAIQATSVIKDQEEITGMVTKQDPQPTMKINQTSNDGKTPEGDLHIDSIAIRVVPAVTDTAKTAEQRTISNIPATEKEANETKQITLNSHQDNDNSNADVQKVLSSVKKQLQKISNQQNYNGATNGNPENDKNRDVHKTGDETNKQLTEEGYFQVERRDNSTNVGDTPEAVSTGREIPRSLSNSDTTNNKSLKEERRVFAMDKSKTLESSSVSSQEGNIKTSKVGGSLSDGKSNKDEKMGAGHTHHTRKHHTAKRSLQTVQENTVTAKTEVRPKPKVPIPEISALADYARLKVIVSQDSEDTVQELPPNKKEGFFPLIQSRHSRRPVFTADPTEVSVTEKNSQHKPEAPVKPSKEPKPIVFPITDMEHQRTGMFKLGDKEKQDAKESQGTEDTSVKNIKDVKPSHMEQTKSISSSKTKQNEETKTEEKIRHMVEERRASLAEEERRAAKREEEQRAREREAIAMQLRERRKKQERPEEEERKAKLVEQQIDPQIKAKEIEEEQKEEKISTRKEHQSTSSGIHEKQKTALTEQSMNMNLEEHQRRAIWDKQQGKAAVTVEKRKSALEEQQKKAALIEQQHQKVVHEEQQRKVALENKQKKDAQIDEQKRRLVQEEKQIALEEKATLEEQQRKAALEEQQRKMAQEEQQRKATIIEEQKRRAILEEEQRKAAINEEQKIRVAHEEQQRKAALEEEQRKAAQVEQQRKATLIEEQRKRAVYEEQQRKAALAEQHRRAALEEKKQKAALEEQQRKAALEEQQRKAALEEQQRKAALEEQQRKAAQEEERRKAALEEQQRKVALEEQQRKATIIEEQKARAILVEQQRKAALEEQQRRAALEEKKQKAALEEQQKRAAVEEQQRKVALEEQKRKAALEEQQKKMAQEEQQRKAIIIEEQKRRAILEEKQRKAALEEQQRRVALEENKQKAALEEEQRRAVQEEQQRKTATSEEQKRRAAHEEQQRKSALEEEQRRALQEERQRKMAQEEQQRKATLIEERKRRAILEEEQRKAAMIEEQKIRGGREEQQRQTALEEQKEKSALKEKQIKATTEEQQRVAALTDKQKRKAAQEEQLRKAGVIKEQKWSEEQQRRAALEEQKRKTALEEEQRKAAIEEQQRKDALVEKQRQARQVEEEKRLAYIREERIRRQIEEEKDAQIAEERRRQQSQQQNKAVQLSEQVRQTKDKWRSSEKEKQMHEEGQTELGKVTGVTRETDIWATQSANQEKASEGEHKNVSEKTDALQYYSLTTAEAVKLSPPQQRNSTNGRDAAGDSGSYNRPHAPVSPAPSLPRSSASSPALGTKPSMFKVKDNTIRGSALTKSIKPRFHKNFGEEFRVGSPMERVLEKSEEDQDILRRSAGTPVYPDTGLNKLASTTQGYSTPLPQHRPYSRRSLVLDEEDSHSIISNMSEDVESFATSGGDLADIRALYDSERPDSACSFSSDVSRSLGKPPAVPPKSEKALRRAKRLATRRLKKEMSKAVTDEASEAALTEVGVTNDNAVASPHFAPPVSLAHAPTSGSSLSSSHQEHPSPQRSFHSSPHATAPISLPIASPHSTAPVSTPIASSHNAGPHSTSAAPKTIPHVSSSPTPHHAPKPVTQYQVESSFPQSYPVTQRKVLQDIGSGQYYVVDVPVEVKTKTFFDPETGKYVQLNVRESSRNTPQRQALQGYPQPQLKPQVQAKAQQQQQQQTPPAAKPSALYQGYPGYPKGYQSAATSSGPPHQSNSVTPATFTQDQQPVRVGHNHRYDGPEIGHRYSPEKTPYMDTVNTDKTYNAVYSTQDSQGAFSEGDTNRQIDNSRSHSRYRSRDIITMSELEDFMEVSDW